VRNFRSLREERVLSLVASTDAALEDSHTLSTGLAAVPRLVRSAAIYGPNASGKSNIVKALQYMRGAVLQSAAMVAVQGLALQPFRLDAEYEKQPSEFEVTFISDGVRYQYGFARTRERVVQEHLLVYKTAKPQRWFERSFDEATGQDLYEFGPGLKGPRSGWEKATRADALFLSVAVQLNSESLRPVFDWFAHRLVIFNESSPLGPQFTVGMLKDAEGRRRICDFLAAADISIADIEVTTQKVPAQFVQFDLATGKAQTGSREIEQDQLRLSHVADAGTAMFDLGDESAGTRNLLFLSGPVLDILDKGLTLIVDELGASLHPHLVQALVRLFHRSDMNNGGAQLVFTTHDATLLGAYGLFRRDQVWFVEKQLDQSSKLYSLLDRSPRKDEALERGYLQGRYGAVPILSGVIGPPQ
jgi:AAA15 family ATPase/GTPase